MPRKTDITPLQIELICEKIEKEGNKPTVDRVRAELGTGSRTTINRMIREWEKNRGQYSKDGIQVTDEMENLFSKLLKSMGEGYLNKIDEMSKDNNELKSRVQHYLDESQKHLEEVEVLEKKNKDFSTFLSLSENKVTEQKKQLRDLEEKLGKLGNMEIQVNVLQEQNKELKIAKDNDKKEIGEFMTRAISAEKELEFLKAGK